MFQITLDKLSGPRASKFYSREKDRATYMYREGGGKFNLVDV